MEKFEYFGGIPEIGIVPRAPHAGPLVRHVYEQELGRGGFAGKVTHTYHLYPPNNWLPDETKTLEGAAWAPHWDSPLRDVGGTHHALGTIEPAATGDVYRGMARLIANATVAMNVTAPGASIRRGRLAGHVSALSLRGGRRASPRGGPLARAALGAYRVHPARLLHLRLYRALRREGRTLGTLLPQEPGLL